MTKEEVLEKFEQFKGKPIKIFCDNAIFMYVGIEGHWVFTDDTGVLEIRKNGPADPSGVPGMDQNESPFVITYTEWEHIQYIMGYLPPDTQKITNILQNLTPIGTDKSIDEIIKDITSDRILMSASPRGWIDDERAFSDSYGQFPGFSISTSVNGPDPYVKHLLKKQEEKKQEEENNESSN